ncbi:hypothetical protein LWE61_20265 [Sphingobium sufflavum]|uniref:hypothetical protein n=1 Tax=Sphingobium sufflavum TaxID=1129547 RepID=UPI001F46F931|nr:hypothetical protein [Sphingobium sufflavum]MCE7798868.1 hypothetical protein [Sphingobium sufflavum]
MPTLFLRIADILLALFWTWILIQSLRWGRIGGGNGYQSTRSERPGLYWFGIFIMFLMVLHFGGLAIVGQAPRA